MRTSPTVIILFLSSSLCSTDTEAFTLLPRHTTSTAQHYKPSSSIILRSYNNEDDDANKWISTDETYEKLDDWKSQMQSRKDGSLWSSFTPDESNSNSTDTDTTSTLASESEDPLDDGEAWLDVLASVAADEIDFINTEADRADKMRQMQEWGFEASTIQNTLGVATDDSNEIDVENTVYEKFKEETAKSGFGMYLDDDVDLTTVESHTTVQREEETGELIRTQMVYVDEHSCIGCTHCAGIAQSTFFMEPDLGRARVFQQWGDDQETIEIAIDTCPVNCIHYIPYEELESLELERRGQNINPMSLIAGDNGSGPRSFTGAQAISGNMGSRCGSCPSRGCADCPMFGVGKNPSFEKREKERKEKMAIRKMKRQMEDQNRSAEL